MAWYDEAIFYHIYPLGMTGASKQNAYGVPEHRLNTLIPWISHIKAIGCNALYIGPLFESVGHGYETTDYKRLDSRLGTNEDLTDFVKECHKQGIRVILDGVFNHTGRDFFAFKDLQKNREHSAYRDWFCNVNFGGNNEYNDGFCYENWGGYNLLVKLNQHNQAVKDYICDVIRFWVKEFDIDGIRLDAADVLDFGYMQALRKVAEEVKEDFWLMGEVIHGDYSRWANENTLHSVTNYQLHKALYSGHNDHNYFEIAHTVKRLYEMGGNKLKLYNFVDNHDVERIYTKLTDKAHFVPVHILMYTLPGIPSLYYGSEFGMEGKKEKFSDDSLRPALAYEEYMEKAKKSQHVKLISALGKIRQETEALSYGDYKELLLTNCQYAFSRNHNGNSVLVAVNNSGSDYSMTLSAGNCTEYIGVLSGEKVLVNNGNINVTMKGNSGEIFVPATGGVKTMESAPMPATGGVKTMESAPMPATGGVKTMESAPMPVTTVGQMGKAVRELVETVGQMGEVVEMHVEGEEQPAGSIKEEVAAVGEEFVGAAEEIEKMGSVAMADANKTPEEMTVEELQQKILECMAKNGPVTEDMKRTVRENVYHNSLVTWVKSFR